MRVIAIGGDDVIVVARRRDSAADNSFLANVKMAEAADLLRLILLTGTFFKAPDQQHQREHLDFVALLRRRHGTHAVCGRAVLARETSALRLKLMQIMKRKVKK